MSGLPIRDGLNEQTQRLLKFRSETGTFPGKLSSSALATAVAVRALMSVDPERYSQEIHNGLAWLEATQLGDGSWGDTPDSQGNISTTVLCYSALHGSGQFTSCRKAAGQAIKGVAGSLEAADIRTCILEKYGQDRTFSAPILALAAVSGVLGEAESAWDRVPQLPFELAILPRWLFRFLKLDVVSYAVPALIAIGLVRHVNRPGRFSPLRFLRTLLTPKLLDRLSAMQPSNGGFLEAAPLTSFVTMALAEGGYKSHPVVKKGVSFILGSVRDDGSLPIDTNLETWLTSQAVKALGTSVLSDEERSDLRQWYINQQFKGVHPFTGAAPGGWGWTSLPGSVPDADDTAGALLAIHTLSGQSATVPEEVVAGLRWLMALQNTDGGIPTFCRGWGKLPFDRSCPDITGHVLEAFSAWHGQVDTRLRQELLTCSHRCLRYLASSQRTDGSWLPLWFGNEAHPDTANPCYGTAMVLDSLNRLHSDYQTEAVEAMRKRAETWLWENRNDDGSWGGAKGLAGTREETALAIAALATQDCKHPDLLAASTDWLLSHQDLPPAPIGLYFASLWYYEALYPEIFVQKALRSAQTLLD